jgi:hypothetical protein
MPLGHLVVAAVRGVGYRRSIRQIYAAPTHDDTTSASVEGDTGLVRT